MGIPAILFLCLSLGAFAQTQEEDRLRESLSREAETPRLLEAVQLATSGLESASPEVDCDEPRKFVVVGVSGLGTGENGKGQPSGAHDNLPSSEQISSTLRITHSTSKARLQEIVNGICGGRRPSGVQRPGLIIMANSWGSGAAGRLSRMYEQTCGEQVELFVMVDGVSKPIGPYRKTPPARRCINYYQRLSTIRGNSIEGCENHDLSSNCSGGGLANCHIQVEWEGSGRGAQEILKTVR